MKTVSWYADEGTESGITYYTEWYEVTMEIDIPSKKSNKKEGSDFLFGISTDGTLATPYIGYTVETGDVGKLDDSKSFVSHGIAHGLEASLGLNFNFIFARNGQEITADDLAGNSTNFTFLLMPLISIGFEADGHYDYNFWQKYTMITISLGPGLGFGSTSRQKTDVFRTDPRIDRTWPTIKF